MRFPNFFLVSGNDECPPMIEAFENLENVQLAIWQNIESISDDYQMTDEEVDENVVFTGMYASLLAGNDFYWWNIVPAEEIEWGD